MGLADRAAHRDSAVLAVDGACVGMDHFLAFLSGATVALTIGDLLGS